MDHETRFTGEGPPQWARAQIVLFIGLVASVTGQSFLFLVLPPLGRQLGFSDLQSGLVLSVSALLLIASAPVWGFLSERIGRRPVVLCALAASALATAMFTYIVHLRLDGSIGPTTALTSLFAVRLLQSLLIGGLLPAAQAYIADITSIQRRTSGMGLIGAAYGLGLISGSALAWQVAGENPALAFGLTSLFLACAFAGGLLFIKEPHRHYAAPTSSDGHLSLARIWPFLAITLVAFTAYSIVQQVMALWLQDNLGFSPEDSIARAGAALMGTAIAMIVVQGGIVRLFSHKPEQMLAAGASLAALSMVFCSFARTYEELLAILILFGIALGFMLPGNLASLSLRTGSSAQGKAAGINAIGQGLGLAIGPLSGAALYSVSSHIPFIAATTLLFFAAGFAIVAWRSSRRAVFQNSEPQNTP